MSNEEAGTALVEAGKKPPAKKAPLVADTGQAMAIVPRNMEEAMRYANGLISAEQVPDAYRLQKNGPVNASLVAMGVLKALEVGFQVQTGLANLMPINGRFSVWGDGAQALVLGSGKLTDQKTEWVGPNFDQDSTPLDKWPNEFGCKFTAWREGVKTGESHTFTVGDARRAGLWNHKYKKPWVLYPKQMLFNRARAFVYRSLFSDALQGLGIFEEQRDITGYEQRKGTVDNSALDDDVVEADYSHTVALDDNFDPDAALAAYYDGLPAQGTLEELESYQARPENIRLLEHLRDNDEQVYHEMVAANSRRYQEIESAERAAEAEEAGSDDAESEEGEQADLLKEEKSE